MSFVTAFFTLFFLMDPFGNLGTFQSVLGRVPAAKRRSTLVREIIIAYGILCIVLFSGQSIMSALGLRQQAITISGGVVLFLIALGMVFPSRGLKPGEDEGEPFIVPLATPLIVGPSVIAAVLLLVSKHPDRLREWWLAMTAAWAVGAVILLGGGWLLQRLGQRGTRALEKLTGMLLIMISIQMLLDGFSQATLTPAAGG